MTRTAEIASALRGGDRNRAALCLSEVCERMGLNRRTVEDMLKDVPYIPFRRKHLYLITDLAKKMAKMEALR